MKKRINKQNKFDKLVIILIVSTILFSTPSIISIAMNDTSLKSEDAYYHSRIIETIKKDGLSTQDELQHRPYSFNGYHVLIGLLGVSSFIYEHLLPIILGLVSLILMNALSKELNISSKEKFFIHLLFVSSPLVVFIFSTISPLALALPFLILSAILYIKKNPLSILTIIVVTLIDIPLAIALGLLMTLYSLFNEQKISLAVLNAISIIATITILYLFNFNPLTRLVLIEPTISTVFTSFGATEGYSMVILILGFIGLAQNWNKSVKTSGFYLMILFLFIASMYYPSLRILVMIVASIYAGKAFHSLIKKDWNIPAIKDITLLLVMCIIIFSITVSIKSEITFLDKNTLEAIDYLSTVNDNKLVLSSEENGFLIQKNVGKETFLDSSSKLYTDYSYRKMISEKIFYSRNLIEIEELLQENNITHIYINKKMVDGQIWNSPNEGLLFILKNSNKFINLYFNEDASVYRYVGKELK